MKTVEEYEVLRAYGAVDGEQALEKYGQCVEKTKEAVREYESNGWLFVVGGNPTTV